MSETHNFALERVLHFAHVGAIGKTQREELARHERALLKSVGVETSAERRAAFDRFAAGAMRSIMDSGFAGLAQSSVVAHLAWRLAAEMMVEREDRLRTQGREGERAGR